MRFLEEKKGIIISFIIGVILASSITVYATSYFAKDITYKDDKSVADALNELYKKQIQFDIDDDVIHGGDSTVVTNISGLEIGKYYIIYIRHINDNIPTMSNIEFIMPMRKIEYINTDALNYKNLYIGIVKTKSQTINLSDGTVISAKKLNY